MLFLAFPIHSGICKTKISLPLSRFINCNDIIGTDIQFIMNETNEVKNK